jgi:hypothetical protein
MKKYSVLILSVLLFSTAVMAAKINVTFRLNASTVERITPKTSVVDLRGTVTQWGAGTDMTNVGGDYWEITVSLDSETAYEYKYGARDTTATGVEEWWENDIPGASYSGNNRSFTTGTKDTTIGLDYLGSGPDNNKPPYTPSDSTDVYFRVNMGALAGFNFATESVYMVGAFPGPDGAGNMWDPAKYKLTREGDESDYYGFHLKLDPAKTYDSTMYRFTRGAWDGSEDIKGHGMFPDNENRGVSIGKNDTTIAWKWWNDAAPQPAGSDTANVKFRADLTTASDEKGFNIGDTLLVQWGFNNTAKFGVDTMVNEGLSNFYSVTVTVRDIKLGANVNYQYHKIVSGNTDEEIFFDFDETESGSAQKSRKVFIPASPSDPVEANDTEDSNTDLHRRPRFKNSSLLKQPVTVTFECNLRPAFYTVLKGVTLNDIQGDLDITVADSVIAKGVAMNGPATGGWGNDVGADWGKHLMGIPSKAMYDSGTNGDKAAGDSIWTYQALFSPDSAKRNRVGVEFKFGIGGGDNEAGSEQGYGLNHFENIDDSQTEVTIHSYFGSINPNYYIGWDFNKDVRTSIVDQDGAVIRTSQLIGNYPNPFNPVTQIRFTLPKAMDVKLVIYDVLGREVLTLLRGKQNGGGHVVNWNGIDKRGNAVSSGLYFYRLEAGGYSKTMKMMLLK